MRSVCVCERCNKCRAIRFAILLCSQVASRWPTMLSTVPTKRSECISPARERVS